MRAGAMKLHLSAAVDFQRYNLGVTKYRYLRVATDTRTGRARLLVSEDGDRWEDPENATFRIDRVAGYWPEKWTCTVFATVAP